MARLMAMSKTLLAGSVTLGMAMGILPLQAQAAPSQSPTAFVKQISDKLVDRLVKDRASYQRNPQVLVQIVDDNIKPYVDFDGFARGVLGRYARQATPQQIQAFERNLERSLIRGYAKYLGQYNNQSYTILPYKPSSDPTKAVVSMDFKTDTGKSVPVSYQLVAQGNQWKVRNVQVAGIDIGLTFRKQFAATVEQNRGNLGVAIAKFVPSAGE